MPIRITPHHLTLSPALFAKVQNEISSLARFGEDIVKTDIVLRLHRGRSNGRLFSASARLSLPGGDIHASAKHSNLYTAISELEKRLARRLRKRKTRLENRMVMKRPRQGATSAAVLEGLLLPA